MNELVYPEEPRWTGRLAGLPHRRRAALLTMFAIGCLALAILAGYYVSWSSVIFGLVMGFLVNRLGTVVTAESITVRGYLRTWTLPVSQAKEVVARNLTGDPVYLVTQTGRRRRLHRVKPENMTEISELTGLPITDWTR